MNEVPRLGYQNRLARVEAYIKDGSGSLQELLEECVQDGGLEALICVSTLD